MWLLVGASLATGLIVAVSCIGGDPSPGPSPQRADPREPTYLEQQQTTATSDGPDGGVGRNAAPGIAADPPEDPPPGQPALAKHYAPFETLLAKEARDLGWAPAEEKVLLTVFQSGLADVEILEVYCATTACRVRIRGAGKSDAGPVEMIIALNADVLARRFVGFQRLEDEETTFHISRLGYTVPHPDGTPYPVVLSDAGGEP